MQIDNLTVHLHGINCILTSTYMGELLAAVLIVINSVINSVISYVNNKEQSK
jgi:hypothetical protein